MKNKQPAEELLRTAQKAYPRFSPLQAKFNPYALLDEILKKKKDVQIEERLKNLKEQTSQNEKAYRAAFAYAELLQENKDYTKAIKAYKRAIYINAYELLPHIQSAECYRQLNTPNKAYKEYLVALELDPYSQKALEGAILTALELKKIKKAQRFAKILKKHFPDTKLPEELQE